MADTTYIDQYINDGKTDSLSLTNLYDTILVGDVNRPDHIYRIPINDFFLKYKNELNDIVNIYALKEDLYYKPKTLSLMEYGTTEFWLAILRVNGMKSITEFCRPYIYMYEPNSLMELVKTFFKREGKI